MSELTVYGTPGSRTYRTLWMAMELGLDYRNEPVNHHKGENTASNYVAINPNGKVPALRDGDFILWESFAINLYLARKFPGEVSPRTCEEEMLAVQWSMWGLVEVEAFAADLMAERQKPDSEQSTDVVAHLRNKLPKPLGVLDRVLAGRDYLVGGRFTVADLNTASAIRPIFRSGLDLRSYPYVDKWFGVCLSRPAAKQAVALQNEAMAAL
jgi:glutathione S-transferase